MKALLEKIRKILRSRRTRQMLTRTVSVVAALVVFVTTYALVLPAITMEQNASCGIPEHQHTDSCYEERLVCGLSESAGHHHEASCYEKFLICGLEAHVHSPECYQQDSSVYDTGVSVTESYAAGEEGMGVSAAEESAEEESVSAQAGTEESGAEEAVPKGHDEEGADTEKSDKEESAVEEVVPGEAAPEEYGAEETAPGETVSEEYGTGETASGEVSAEEETAPATDASAVEDTTAAETAGISGTASERVSADGTAAAADMADAENGPFGSGTLTAEGDGYRITLDYTEEAKIPENAELSVREITAETEREAYEACLEQAGRQVASDDKTSVDRKASRFFDIEILVRDTDSEGSEVIRKIEPSASVNVNIQIIDAPTAEDMDMSGADNNTSQSDLTVLHFSEGGVEQIDSTVRTSREQEGGEDGEDKSTGKEAQPAGPATEISFEAESFSIYGVVYTVDFHWEVDGKTYDFTIPGGGFVSFEHLVEALGLGVSDANIEQGEEAEENKTEGDSDGAETTDADSTTYEEAIKLNEVKVSEKTKDFVANVEKVEFSNSELLWVGKLEEPAEVGELRETNGLESEYSADLTAEMKEEINAQTIDAGDWALIGRKAFDTEETLTVTMNNGEVFYVLVTDAQISTQYLSDKGELYEVTVTYGEDAGIPDGSTLKVTEFAEDSKEYAYARKSVLADIKSRNESVDLNSFGFAVMDISIINPEGREIEPEAEVQVNLQIKSLPGVEDLSEVADTLAIQHHVEVDDGVVVENVFNGSPDASFRMETSGTAAADGIAVDPESVKEEDFAAPRSDEADTMEIGFESEAFSTFSISWNYASGNGVKVHYVDENGNELTVNNSSFLTTLNDTSATPAYLIYDIDGYEYDHTYRHYYYNGDFWTSAGWRDQNIVPELRRTDGGWGLSPGWQYSTNGNQYSWSSLSASNATYKDEIYVVYKKKADVVQGGTPTVKQDGSVDPPVSPRINKESTPNGDDTNTLALSLISDTAKLEVEKLADVIVVFDVSGSMNDNDMGDNTTRLQAAKKAVNDLAAHLSQKKNSNGDPLVRMSLIQFSTKAESLTGLTELTTNESNSGLNQITSAVNNLSANGGTNWDHALQLANEENDLDSGRATFIIFVTDGDPTFRNTRMNVTDQNLQEETNDYAWETYSQVSPNPYYLSDTVYGPGDNDKTGKCYDAAVVQGNAIVSAGKNIYTIGISNNVTKVAKFNSDIQGSGAYLADDSSDLEQAFADIEASISGAAGWGNIQMTDGITNLSNTVQKTGLTNVGGDFSYWKAPAPANWSGMTEAEKNAYTPAASDFVSWDPASEGAAPAVYNEETGAVEWNMGDTFMPEGGVTYQVRFKVWPSQEAYDYIAKLNNGTIHYDQLPDGVKAQIIKNGSTYTLKTNEPDAKTTYQSATRTGDTVTVSGDTKTLMFPSVEDLNLSVDKMKVKKEWVNSLDPDARWKSPVTMRLTDGNGTLYKSIELNEDNKYTAEDNFISCGLAKTENNELIIYEKGHDFKLSEPEEFSYYWDLDSQFYRPMIIDATLTMLVKVDPPDGMGDRTYYSEGGVSYYKIEEGIYKAISTGDAAATITATNIRRSNLNLTKKVVDEDGNPVAVSEPFTFRITVNDTWDSQVWFSVQADANDTSTVIKELSTNATAEIKNGEKTGYFYADSGSEITVSIQPGWNLRFTNLPNGTTFTIAEDSKENYDFLNASIDNNGTFSVEDGTTVGTGTINESDKQYTVTYTNRAVTQQVYIRKTGQDAQTPLQGAIFSLYTKDGYEADPQEVLKTELESDEDGKIDLGRLAVGEYYLAETKAPSGYDLLSDPVEITVKADSVQYKQITNSLSLNNEGVSGGRDEGYTLVVTNNAGVELPSTGGPGTRMLYLLGIMLTSLAAAGLFSLVNRNDFIFKIN